ncbi:23S rRNA (guanosine(2251)-2'-O)-methyltransferase RlmB [Candidatus Contubernalis alkaliaceticus]|uniref:23S rRNA (guanosine(2251)-2'-O)-methyltransferase RlmB n=1 Tax=Candidatus Contubernalis alkaliaceticus TaxID=338645 RepID=UPI001F4C02FF|nr:23S rRNA (guanosine(2251)-2'-O)-methyltransferase RlmB [Candidatus Contubernalis alkalaceticus]UNC93342.1 23S rRNA (guanosine(2251)-2'-O)-methyltransferase RlmB [Candidatus Contubernalis alkalaceticus]
MNNLDLIVGRQPVLELLRAGGVLKKVLLASGITGTVISEIEKLAHSQGFNVERKDRKHLDSLAPDLNHQGVIALGYEFRYTALESILSRLEKTEEKPFLVLLDQIQDPQNLGAIIRTAEAVGAHGVVIPSRRSAQVTSAVFKASAGAASYIPIALEKNLNSLVEQLKKKGFWIFGTDASGSKIYHRVDYRIPLALVLGSEGKGISRLLKEKCDYLVNIPMRGKINSLNASAAGAVLMYEVLRQRGN